MADKEKLPTKPTPQPPKSNKNSIIVLIAALAIIVLVIKVYLDSQDKEEMQAFYTEELQVAQVRFDEISAELDQKIKQIDSLGGDIQELLEAKSQIEAEKEQLSRTRTANRGEIRRLRAKTQGYEELLKAKDEEISELTAMNVELLSENTGLKTEKNELNQSIRQLNETRQTLEEKVEKASQLNVENINVLAIAKSGKERPSPFRKRHVEKLKVSFNIADNAVAPIEGKEIHVRVIDHNGQVLFDVARGSGTFMVEGREEFFTATQEILFDNSKQQLTFVYDRGSEYSVGQHTIEVYTDGYLMGREAFIIK